MIEDYNNQHTMDGLLKTLFQALVDSLLRHAYNPFTFMLG